MINTEALKQKILDMAIRGKLVPQNPEDEPASVLLEKIRAEKQQLIKEGKIKKDKNESIIFKGDDNRPYEKVGNNIDFVSPQNWCVCKFSDIAYIFTGNSINEQEKEKKYIGLTCGYNYIGTKDVSTDHSINYENGVKIPYDTSFCIAHKGTPLLCIEGGSAGKKLGILSEDVCFGNKLCAFEVYGNINTRFVYYFLQSPNFIRVFSSSTKGIIGGVSINTIKSLSFFLPPLAEQERIVKKIDELFAQIEIIDKNQADIEKLYDELKKRTLDLAIQGILVPQDPADEPASVLLERIRAEKKAKLGKKYVESYIYKGDDNCYYEHIGDKDINITEDIPLNLPNNWCWAKLETISFTQTGTTPSTSEPDNFGTFIPFIKPGDIFNGQINYNNIGLSKKGLQDGRLIEKDSVLMVCIGGSLGKCALCDREVSCNQQINTATPNTDIILPLYLYYCLNSDYFYKTAKGKATGTATPIINRGLWEQIYIPIPPLAEQQRIVDKINEIFAKL